MNTLMSLPAQRNAVKIGRTLFPVDTLKDAVAFWNGIRAQHNMGASEAPLVAACIDGKLYRISYNGRCWHPTTGAEVIP